MIKKLLSGSFVALLTKTLGAIIAYLAQIFLARLLGSEGYGSYTVIITIVNFSIVFSLFGFNISTIRFVPRYYKRNSSLLFSRYVSMTLFTCFLTTTLVALILVVCSSLIRPKFNLGSDVFYLLIALVPIESMMMLFSSYFQGMNKILVAQAPVYLFRPLVMALACVAFYYYSFDLSVLYCLFISLFSCMAILLFYIANLRKNIRWKLILFKSKRVSRLWIKSSIPFIFIAGCNIFLKQLDILMIGSFLSNSQTGIYVGAVKVSNLVTFVLSSVNIALAPMISTLYSRKNMHELAKLLAFSVRSTSFAALVIVIVLISFSKSILSIFGDEFMQGDQSLNILLMSQLFNTLSGSVGILLHMSGFQNFSVKALALSGVVNAIANIFLIPIYGIVGAAYATLLATMIWNILLVIVAYKFLRINTTIFSTGSYRA